MRALLLLLLTATLSAAGLKVGDPAPATRPESMLQGAAVKEFKKGEVYVFECWASWCGPCVAAIPQIAKDTPAIMNWDAASNARG
mgnify:CR=1 FL=1